ncbi:MAG: glycosyltransferase family 4 protein [Leptolyngbyaceae cyanobacterium bins.349]|nr:glycosyltransferase family 4 protein [Leptolyngbyaceae cyanobacterium bins.349]
MKITFVLPCPNLSGGIRVVGIYAKHLQDRGHQITFVSVPEAQPPLQHQIKSVLKGQGLKPLPQRHPSHLDALDIEHRRLNRYRPVVDADVPDGDVVIATWWETAEWVAKLSPAKGAKAYLIQHYEVFDYLPVERVKATWKLPLHKLVIAQWLADIAVNDYGDRNFSYIPNGIDPSLFFAPPRTKQAVPTIGMMYAVEFWKGSDVGLKALALAKETIPDLQVVAFGHPAVADGLPAGTRYYPQPAQTSLREVYAQCDAWLFTSRFEGFGLPILEAMACRTPVIGTPSGAAPELLADGCGILVKPADPEDMARAIVQVCQMPEQEWQGMSHLAYERVSQYTWDEATDTLEAALKAAMGQQN